MSKNKNNVEVYDEDTRDGMNAGERNIDEVDAGAKKKLKTELDNNFGCPASVGCSASVCCCVINCSNKSRAKFINRRKQFLLSLISDVDKLDDDQMRKFRVSISTMIDSLLSKPETPRFLGPVLPSNMRKS